MFFAQSWETTTYYIWDKMMIDVVDTGVKYEAWVYHTDYGIKWFLFAVEKKSTNKDDFCRMVRNNMDEYIELYKHEYID